MRNLEGGVWERYEQSFRDHCDVTDAADVWAPFCWKMEQGKQLTWTLFFVLFFLGSYFFQPHIYAAKLSITCKHAHDVISCFFCWCHHRLWQLCRTKHDITCQALRKHEGLMSKPMTSSDCPHSEPTGWTLLTHCAPTGPPGQKLHSQSFILQINNEITNIHF